MSGNVVRRRSVQADEADVFSPYARRVYLYTQRPGVCAAIKRRANRRERREGKREVKEQASDGPDT